MAQAPADFKSIEDYKTAEPTVLETANFILDTPADLDELKRLNSFQYILKWMEGTPDYTFSIESEAMQLTDGKTELLTVYLSAMTKAVLDSSSPLTNEQVQAKAKEYTVQYCAKEENHIKPSKAIKKILKSQKS
ncbi:hypothetical protein BFP72_12540 [Reichenbachiella sp. 5M10]|nr:hypothetical protein BFP72_12540 [Reichenbachiella sp. 5M10]